MNALTHAHRIDTARLTPAIPNAPTHESAAPDLPPLVGWAVIGAFMTAMALFILFFSGSLYSGFMTIISLIYLLAYVSVPVVFFLIEPRAPNQIGWQAFTRKGLETFAGHRTAGEAMTEILTIPAGIAAAVLGFGTVGLIVR